MTEEVDAQEDVPMCGTCGGTPCDWIQYGDSIVEAGDQALELHKKGGSNLVRKKMYSTYTYIKYGHLGRGERIRIPSCVLDKIREHWPDVSGKYMGHKEN